MALPFKVGITQHATLEEAKRQAEAQTAERHRRGDTTPVVIFKDGEPYVEAPTPTPRRRHR